MKTDRPHVLVVDDEPDIRDILVEWLDASRYEVETAGNADDALARLQAGGVEALILDLHLPGRDGLEVLEEARRLDGDLSIIIMTGFATTDSAIEALRHGADDYLQKPFDLQSLVHSLDRALEHRRLRRENRQLVDKLQIANRGLDLQVAAKTRSLRTLLDIAHQLACTLELEPALAFIAERAREITGAHAALLFLDHGGEGFGLEVASGIDPSRDRRLLELASRHVERVAAAGQEWQTVAADQELETALGGPVLAVPLLWEGKAIGVLLILRVTAAHGDASQLGGQFDDQRELAIGFAAHAAVAIRNAQIYEEAKRLDRLQSAFIAAVSHELRTPLTGMSAPLELLATKYAQSLNPAGQELLHICKDSVERLEDLVELILFSAETDEELNPRLFEAVEVAELVRESVGLIAGVASHTGVTVESRNPDPTLVVHGYRRGLVRVMVCLLSNAVKFSESGESVFVDVERVDDRVRLHVIDHGVGIDTADQPIIFHRFAQLDGSLTKRAGGTGLGLSVSKALVEQHGGRILVASRAGAGSRFTVDLPLRADGQRAPSASDAPRAA